MTSSVPRNLSVAMLLCVLAAGCTTANTPSPADLSRQWQDRFVAKAYGARPEEKFPLPAVEASSIEDRNVRQLVDYSTREQPGTLVVDTKNRFVYLVQEGGKAMRYGVGVGLEGLEFAGSANVGRKSEWPSWTPTPNMIAREPEKNKKWAGGMKGGLDNPLGARALYLYKNGKDTLFRIHGTNEPESIGHAVSSGCIRMLNQDIIDLYGRVPKGSRVVVR